MASRAACLFHRPRITPKRLVINDCRQLPDYLKSILDEPRGGWPIAVSISSGLLDASQSAIGNQHGNADRQYPWFTKGRSTTRAGTPSLVLTSVAAAM